MELIDMKLPKPKKGDSPVKECCLPTEGDSWPWGLQLRFEKEQIDKLPALKDYKVGDKVVIQAEAMVTSIRISERQGIKGEQKEDHTVEMQIESVNCEPKVKKSLTEMTPKEYRKEREKK